ncbi:SLC13 family permease [Peptococcus simiae]|uniref:SLC13 family permease n=1 Tax=Peptococcus simiae TaxID=1643805 RepID=UPI0039807E0D
MGSVKDNLMLKVIGYLIIFITFCLLPPVGSITIEGMRLLGVFIAFIYGLTVTSEVWPSLLTIVILPLIGLIDFTDLLSYSFGNDVFIFVLLSLVLVSYMDSSGASTFAAVWLLKRPFLKGHPWYLFFMLLFICWLLSSFVNAIAGMMLVWIFLYKIFDQFDLKPFEKLPTIILIGTCVTGGLGLSTLPWGNNSIVILDAFTKNTGLEVNYFLYMGYSIPYSIAAILVYLFLARFLFRVDVEAIKEFDPDTLSQESQVLTREKACALLSIAALVLLILVPTLFPSNSLVATVSNQLKLSGKLIAVFAFLQIYKINGKPACSFVKNAKAGINWNLMMVIVNIMAFSALISSDEVGLNTSLANSIAPFFENKPSLLFIVLAGIMTVTVTNFMSNKIVAVLMISITMPIAQSLGVNPTQLACLYTVICTVAFLLPSSSQSSVVLFSNTKWIRAGDVFKYGFPVLIVLTIIQLGWNIIYFHSF